jgi:cytidylate kinase
MTENLGSVEEGRETPRHGFQGDRLPAPPASAVPMGVTLALSRETGARGSMIARRVGRKLGWQVYDQELLEYVANEGPLRQELMELLSSESAQWVEERLEQLLQAQNISQHPSIVQLARAILALGSQGGVVLIGRGAGSLLPSATTLHVRVVAPLADRIAFHRQRLRLTVEEAVEQVQVRDNHRAEFLATHFHRLPGDIYQYDMVLNSSLLGEEPCADLIAHAVQAKRAAWEQKKGGKKAEE